MSLLTLSTDLTLAVTPAQTKKVESLSRAAMAYASEQNDYETYMQAWRVYILARRKTTELVKSEIGNMDVTSYEGYGFTKMQWSRRLRELAIEQAKIDAYFDELVASGWQPSVNGLLRHVNNTEVDRFARAVVELRRGAKTLADKFAGRLTTIQFQVIEDVLREFEEAE